MNETTTPPSVETQSWPDIGFQAVFALHEYSMSVTLIETGEPDKHFLNGFIKWDGCSNWEPFQHCWHFCSFSRFDDFREAMRRCYKRAALAFPDCDEEALVG